jgi:hypothetical protein
MGKKKNFNRNTLSIQINEGLITESNIVNSTIEGGDIINANIVDLKLKSALIDESTISNSNYANGNIVASSISDSVASNLEITSGTIVASSISDSVASNLEITSGTIVASSIIDSVASNLEITSGTIVASSIIDSIISGNVLISDVQLQNSNLINNLLTGNTIIETAKISKTIIEKSHILDSLLSNVSIGGFSSNIDYTQSPLNGYYSTVFCNQPILTNVAVEITFVSGKIIAQPTNPASRNAFFGIAQPPTSSNGTTINVLTQGVSYIAVRNQINLPVLVRSNTGQLVALRDASGKIITQTVVIPLNKDDLLVLAGTNSDILVGPLTQYYSFNAIGNNGLLTVYKTIQINQATGSYLINSVDQNTIQAQKLINGGKFIQVLEIENDSGRVIGFISN